MYHDLWAITYILKKLGHCMKALIMQYILNYKMADEKSHKQIFYDSNARANRYEQFKQCNAPVMK